MEELTAKLEQMKKERISADKSKEQEIMNLNREIQKLTEQSSQTNQGCSCSIM